MGVFGPAAKGSSPAAPSHLSAGPSPGRTISEGCQGAVTLEGSGPKLPAPLVAGSRAGAPIFASTEGKVSENGPGSRPSRGPSINSFGTGDACTTQDPVGGSSSSRCRRRRARAGDVITEDRRRLPLVRGPREFHRDSGQDRAPPRRPARLPSCALGPAPGRAPPMSSTGPPGILWRSDRLTREVQGKGPVESAVIRGA